MISQRPEEPLRNIAPAGSEIARVTSHRDGDAVLRALWPGLLLLLQAHDYAADTGRDRWEFAVELDDLRRQGFTNGDSRWLVCKGWAELARELRPRPKELRRFQHDVGLAMDERVCLVLTAAGERVARGLFAASNGMSPLNNVELGQADGDGRIKPHWDRDRHELRLGSQLIKQFKLPSPNQEVILMAFEEENWPPRVDDPLPHSKKLDAKQRLHDTIKNLNRNQKARLVRFMGDGTGEGVRWEVIATAAASTSRGS